MVRIHPWEPSHERRSTISTDDDTAGIFPVFELPEQMSLFDPELVDGNPTVPFLPASSHLDASKATQPLVVEEVVTTEREFDGNGNITKETRTVSRPRKLTPVKPLADRPVLPKPDPLPIAPYTPWVVPPNSTGPWQPYRSPTIYTAPPGHQWPSVTCYNEATGQFYVGIDPAATRNWHQG